MRRSTAKPAKLLRLIAATASSALIVGALAASAPSANAATDLGPTIVKTDTAPTGYAVTFRYDNPTATSVQIYGEWYFSKTETLLANTGGDARPGADWQTGDINAGPWDSHEMTQGVDGIWTWTTPLPAGTYSYAFRVDGGTTNIPDPANKDYSQALAYSRQSMSQVYVPQNPLFPTYDYDWQKPAAKTGTLAQYTYDSSYAVDVNNPAGDPVAPTGKHPISVYLPAGYDPNRATPYKTIYVSHGGQGIDTDWFSQGTAQNILENAVVDGTDPVILVGINYQGFNAAWNNSSTEAIQAFADDLVANGIPFIESNFNVSKNAIDRGFISLSAGGLRLLEFLYNRPGVFEYYGILSAGGGSPMPTAAQRPNIAKTKGIVYISVGYQDWQNNINVLSYARASEIRRAGIVVDEQNIRGIHSWDVWRQQLNYFIRNVAFKAPQGNLSVSGASVTGGTVKVGDTLTATAPTIRDKAGAAVAGATVTYQWLRGGKAISGATARAYTAVAADKGAKLAVRVTVSKSGYVSASSTSAATSTVKVGALKVSGKAKIKGTKRVGKKLKAVKPKISTAGTKVTYQWLRAGKKIKGKAAKKATYKLVAKDRGKKISVKVTIKKAGYTTVTKTSAKTAAIKKKKK